MKTTRRSFIAAGSAAAAGVALASPADALQKLAKPASAPQNVPKGKAKAKGLKMYRLSVRGRRACSNLSKRLFANLRFQTKAAARNYPLPHPGIHAKIVPLDVSANEFHRLFVATHNQVADLSKLQGFKVVGL